MTSNLHACIIMHMGQSYCVNFISYILTFIWLSYLEVRHLYTFPWKVQKAVIPRKGKSILQFNMIVMHYFIQNELRHNKDSGWFYQQHQDWIFFLEAQHNLTFPFLLNVRIFVCITQTCILYSQNSEMTGAGGYKGQQPPRNHITCAI